MSKFNSEFDAFNRNLEKVFREALDEYGGRIEDEIAAKLNNPYPPASVEGEFPHRRTGLLRAGLSHVTSAEGTLMITEIISVREGGNPKVPGYLDQVMNRPYMTDTYLAVVERFPREIVPIIVSRMNSL